MSQNPENNETIMMRIRNILIKIPPPKIDERYKQEWGDEDFFDRDDAFELGLELGKDNERYKLAQGLLKVLDGNEKVYWEFMRKKVDKIECKVIIDADDKELLNKLTNITKDKYILETEYIKDECKDL